MADPAIIVNTAAALTAHLSGGQYTLGTITAERSYADWTLALTVEEQLRVDVLGVLKMAKLELSARKKLKHICPIDVAIRKKFGVVSQDGSGGVAPGKVDELMLFTQESHVLCTPQRLPDFPGAVWQDTTLLFAPSHKHLFSFRQFTAVIRVTFRVDQDL